MCSLLGCLSRCLRHGSTQLSVAVVSVEETVGKLGFNGIQKDLGGWEEDGEVEMIEMKLHKVSEGSSDRKSVV